MANSLRDKAVKLLSQREHSRAELRRKLGGHDPTADEIEAVLDDLVERQWQSDARFAIAYVDANASKFGRYRLEHTLRERGVADSDIAAAFAQLAEGDDELTRARDIWRKKFKATPVDATERAKQARFLQSRGFSFEIIRRVIAGLDDE